ncbi:uncharacterized protein TRUGW13939_07305 [Talaromyces rugulosus]|uniref:RING-type domain-containing protein n=1 Tax=Talaromyces rugulosus TaxID=121627 RepID=A0A7H8R1C0_TALRU|nr:uncharacterized protein TRUGW13939_07305 [Talaromyces rugulosus]QKX60162.1 hypothetical protein TRUGW13939_07305 [Talaromyces rugulosus]
MTTLDDLLAVNPAANDATLACLGTTRTNEQCGVSTKATSNPIIRDNNQTQQRAKEKEKQKTAATWKKIQRNAQRRRKIVVGDDDLEYLARLSLCTRHRRSSQIKNLVRRIKDDITTHNQSLATRKPAATTTTTTTTTTTSEMDPSSFEEAGGYAVRRQAQERAQHTLNVAVNVYRAVETGVDDSNPRSVTQGGQDQMNQSPEDNEPSDQDQEREQDSRTTPIPLVEHSHIGEDIGPDLPPCFSRDRRQGRKPIAPNDECAICLERMGSKQDLAWCRKQCGTNFHGPCIENWISIYERGIAKTCPACRVVWSARRDWGDLR